MYFLFSGEGPTDVGVGTGAATICEGDDFGHGPMAIIVDQLVEDRQGYSPLGVSTCGIISEHSLAERARQLKTVKKSLRLPGVKQPKETRYFFNNARILARIAREKRAELADDVVAILFRDSDGTASAGRGQWEDKRRSIIHGFDEERFTRGVPMIPKPKSEAWVLCGLTGNPNYGGGPLEERSGNDNSPNSLKDELKRFAGKQLRAKRCAKWCEIGESIIARSPCRASVRSRTGSSRRFDKRCAHSEFHFFQTRCKIKQYGSSR